MATILALLNIIDQPPLDPPWPQKMRRIGVHHLQTGVLKNPDTLGQIRQWHALG